MTTYELIKTIDEAQRERLIRAGIIPEQWTRFTLMYEYWTRLVEGGVPKMDAYWQTGEKFFASECNVRRIIGRMAKAV